MRVRSVNVMPSGASRVLAASTYTGLLCTQGLPSRTCARASHQPRSHPGFASSASLPAIPATARSTHSCHGQEHTVHWACNACKLATVMREQRCHESDQHPCKGATY